MADYEEVVTREDGTTHRVVGTDKKEVAQAVKALDTYPEEVAIDINVPVMKGHDLVVLEGGVTGGLADGTGAHNSPRNAIRDDGSVEGSDPLLVVPSAKVPHAASVNLEEVVGSGETKEVDLAKLEVPSDKLNIPTNQE